MYKITPAMGWNTWNTFTTNINEKLILESAQSMIDTGLKDYGYEYIVIDDCWSLNERDENGRLVPDPERFPHGMKYVADKVHALGLKLGMYSCAGTVTCERHPGSYEHEFIDAKTFAEWGVDYLKYDYCFHSIATPGHLLYKRMGLALSTCGRDILFSACSWGADDTRIWIKETGAHSWRSTADIKDGWWSIKQIALDQIRFGEYNGQGCFNDMDMLVVGIGGKGMLTESNGCTYDEYFTHFAFWCMFGSPLMIGCDIRTMDDEARKILTNKDLIRINQDKKHNQPFVINVVREKNFDRTEENPAFYKNYGDLMPVVAKYLDDGKIAIGFFNFSDGASIYWFHNFNTESVGVPMSSGKTLKMKDVATGEVITVKNGYYATSVPAHASRVFIAEVVNL